LWQYANEAPYAATRPDGNPWPSGTGSENEKRILYAVTRALNPILALDLGTGWGAAAVQMATGNRDASDPPGRVISVSNTKLVFGKHPAGKFIPKNMKVPILVVKDIASIDRERYFELIYEDTDHTYETTKRIWEVAQERMVEGAVIISHDAAHPKFQVLEGIRAAGIEPEVYLVDGDSCGLAIWQKPGKEEKPVVVESVTIGSHTWESEGEFAKGKTEEQGEFMGLDHLISTPKPELPEPDIITAPATPKRKRKKRKAKPVIEDIPIEKIETELSEKIAIEDI
jgi:hypothetical protein